MIEVIGGNLFQWDTGRVAQVNTGADIHEVHFTTKDMTYAYVVSTYEKDGTVYCEIPNILLQQEKSLICYEVTNTDGGEMTVAETTLALHKKNKKVEQQSNGTPKIKQYGRANGGMRKNLKIPAIVIQSNREQSAGQETHSGKRQKNTP